MPETRYTEVYAPGTDTPVLIDQIPYEVSDEELFLEQLDDDVNSYHTLAQQAYRNYDSLTVAQKDKILKFLLGYYITSAHKLGYF